MKKNQVVILSRPKLKHPVLVVGLPGMGHVGKLAVEHLIEELGAKKIAELRSYFFPHYVFIERGGVLKLPCNTIHYAKAGENDLLLLSGDVQPISPEGQYMVANEILDLVEGFGGKPQIFTLGGYATGHRTKGKPKVVCVVSHEELLDAYSGYGVETEAGAGPIIGASGLLIGLGRLRGMLGVCLLGETQGAIIDPRSAEAVLGVLMDILNFKVDTGELRERAKETERVLSLIQGEMERRLKQEKTGEEAWYIG